MKDNPDDEKGWIMLARSYKTLGRLQEAADAYAKGGKLLQENAALLTDYAETLASLSEGRFAGKPTQLINQALKLNPEEPQALILAVAAGEREDYKAAIGYWERKPLPMVEPGSEEETSPAKPWPAWWKRPRPSRGKRPPASRRQVCKAAGAPLFRRSPPERRVHPAWGGRSLLNP